MITLVLLRFFHLFLHLFFYTLLNPEAQLPQKSSNDINHWSQRTQGLRAEAVDEVAFLGTNITRWSLKRRLPRFFLEIERGNNEISLLPAEFHKQIAHVPHFLRCCQESLKTFLKRKFNALRKTSIFSPFSMTSLSSVTPFHFSFLSVFLSLSFFLFSHYIILLLLHNNTLARKSTHAHA